MTRFPARLAAVLRHLAVLAVAAGIGTAHAQAWPTKPVRVVIPFTAGSSPDVTGRLFFQKLGEALGQQIVVENRTGAAGIIGTELVAKAAPDGYTLLYTINSVICANPHLYSKLPYDPFRSFVPISMAANLGYVVMAKNDLPVKTIQDLFAMAKANPGKLNFGSAGLGGGNHVSMELLLDMARLQMTHVPSRDSATSVATGETDLALVPYTTAVPLARGGRTRALAVTLDKRLPVLPDLPTVAELLPGYFADAWHGLLAPAGTPPAIIERLGAEMQRIARLPEIEKRLADIGVESVGSSPADFAAKIRADHEKWGGVIRKANIKLD
jgi:tripartite-type tricarboxylate transporter receptor subunit TctC